MGGRGDFGRIVGETADDADHVAVDGCVGESQGDAGNGRGGVGSRAGEAEDSLVAVRDALRVNQFRRAVQVPRPAVITEAAPGGQYIGFGGVRQGLNAGEPLEEAMEIRNYRLHACLLEHDFGNPDAIEVGGLAPGEIAANGVIPGQQGSAEGDRCAAAQR